MLTIGIDIHTRSHSICVLDARGKIDHRDRIHGGHDELVEYLRRFGDGLRICFEASVDCGVLYDRFRELPQVRSIVVAHPAHLQQSPRKNDRADAQRLAIQAFHGHLRSVHVPDTRTRNWRQLIECRCRVVQCRTRVKNGLKSLLRSRGIQAPKALWSKEGRHWLRHVPLPDSTAKTRRRLLLEQLRLFDRQVKLLGRMLNAIAVKDERVDLLRTVPGVGIRTAEAMVAWIDDPARFARSSRAGAYFGLVPRQNQSGERNHLGGINKCGPKLVRWLLVEAAWRAIRKDGPIRDRYLRLLRQDPQRKRRATVAIARWLGGVMLAMLRDSEPWQPSGRPAQYEEICMTP